MTVNPFGLKGLFHLTRRVEQTPDDEKVLWSEAMGRPAFVQVVEENPKPGLEPQIAFNLVPQFTDVVDVKKFRDLLARQAQAFRLRMDGLKSSCDLLR